MATVYVIGNGEVFLDWYAYRNYCLENRLKIEYEEPKVFESPNKGEVL